MDALLDSIRIAMADGASDGERRRGASACRALADALDGGILPGDAPPAVAAPIAASPVVPEVAALAPFLPAGPLASNPFDGMTPDQILDLAIAKLRGAIGNDAPPEPVGAPFRLTLVPVPRMR